MQGQLSKEMCDLKLIRTCVWKFVPSIVNCIIGKEALNVKMAIRFWQTFSAVTAEENNSGTTTRRATEIPQLGDPSTILLWCQARRTHCNDALIVISAQSHMYIYITIMKIRKFVFLNRNISQDII